MLHYCTMCLRRANSVAAPRAIQKKRAVMSAVLNVPITGKWLCQQVTHLTEKLSFCLLDSVTEDTAGSLEEDEETSCETKTASFCLSDIFHEGHVCFRFCYDFGPPSAGSIYMFCKVLEDKLVSSGPLFLHTQAKNTKVRFYSLISEAESTSNSVCLMGAFCVWFAVGFLTGLQVLYLGWSSEETKKKLQCFFGWLFVFKS